MTDFKKILQTQKDKLLKAVKHLDFSYKKISLLPADARILDEEQLETWESFATRFSRVVDIFLIKYLRTFVLQDDPGFQGSLRDFVNQAEKLNLIDSTDYWMKLRELRNLTAHDYNEEELSDFFEELKKYAPQLISTSSSLIC